MKMSEKIGKTVILIIIVPIVLSQIYKFYHYIKEIQADVTLQCKINSIVNPELNVIQVTEAMQKELFNWEYILLYVSEDEIRYRTNKEKISHVYDYIGISKKGVDMYKNKENTIVINKKKIDEVMILIDSSRVLVLNCKEM